MFITRKWILFLIVFTFPLVAIFYNNCAPQKISNLSQPYSFQENKFQLKLQANEYTLVQNNLFLAGTIAVVILKGQCEPIANSLSFKILNQNSNRKELEIYHQELSFYTASYQLEDSISAVDFKKAIDADPCILGIENNARIELDSVKFNDPYHARNTALQRIQFSESYDFFNHPTMGANTIISVGVIDTGIDSQNLDLQNKIFIASDSSSGFNVITGGSNVADSLGHGTYISSLIAAESQNQFGIVGIAAHQARIYPIKVTDSQGSSSVAHIAQAIDKAKQLNLNVVNISMSFEGTGTTNSINDSLTLKTSIEDAVSTKNIFFVLSAGNKARTFNSTYGPFPAYHAQSINGCLSVGSIHAQKGTLSSFSNYSPSLLEITAPGEGTIVSSSTNSNYTEDIGTSFSAPLVTGAVVLTISFLKSHSISYNAADVEQIISSSSKTNPQLLDKVIDGKELNLKYLGDYLAENYLGYSGGWDE